MPNNIFENYYINYNDQSIGSLKQYGNDNVLSNGTIQSSNFIKGDPTTGLGGQGFGLYGDGNAYFNNGIFRGMLTASEIHIPYKEVTQSFHVLVNGNMFSGCKNSEFTANIENAPFYVLNNGTLKATIGKIGATTIYQDRIVGGLIKTSDGTTRIEIDGTANEMRIYNGNVLVSSWGAFDGAEGEMFNINYNTTSTNSPFYVRGNVPNTAVGWFHNSGNNRALTVSANTSLPSGALFVKNGTSTTTGTGIAGTFQSAGTDKFSPVVYIACKYENDTVVPNGIALRLNGRFINDDQEPRADNTYDIGTSSIYYKKMYVREVKTGYLEPYSSGSNIGEITARWNVMYAQAINLNLSTGLTINGNAYTPQTITYVTSVTFNGDGTGSYNTAQKTVLAL